MSKNTTVEKILLCFDPEAENLLPVLKEIVASFGFVCEKDAMKVADYFELPLSKVYETASFYDLIRIKKPAILELRVCSGAECSLGGTSAIISEIENYFKIKSGDRFNPKVSLEVVSCLGRCGDGPILIVNGKVYERVTAGSIHQILGGLI